MSDIQNDEHEWVFEPGDLIADEMPQYSRMPGVGVVDSPPEHDYEVIKRMYDADSGDPLYLVEKTQPRSNGVYRNHDPHKSREGRGGHR